MNLISQSQGDPDNPKQSGCTSASDPIAPPLQVAPATPYMHLIKTQGLYYALYQECK